MATATDVKVLEARKFVAVNTADNNNKFWQYEHLAGPVTETNNKGKSETGDTRITWGRVGAARPDQQLINWDVKTISGKIADKADLNSKEVYSRIAAGQGLEGLVRKGKRDDYYTEVKTVGAEPTPKPFGASTAYGANQANAAAVKKAAVEDIAGGCVITAALVKKLAETNKHELVAATGGLDKGGMDIDLETGMVRTPLGVVTLDAIKEGRRVLDKMLPFVQKHDTDNRPYMTLFDQYLRNIPQFIGYKRGSHVDFINIAAQTSLLDQLETSVELAEQRMKDALTKGDKTEVVAARKAMFECKLALVDAATVEGGVVWKRIEKMYYDTRNYGHSSSSLKPVRVYSVTIPHMVAAFDREGRKVGNIKQLWHGTRIFNILSILKRGFVLPSSLSTAQTCGAMFGPGVYFSDQSTKSLNYATNYWSGGPRVTTGCFMFLNDVAMGREYTPTGPCSGIPSHYRSQYDSIFAVARRSGVQNNEMIIPKTAQANIKYLIEFSE